jgi:hypothetical protein
MPASPETSRDALAGRGARQVPQLTARAGTNAMERPPPVSETRPRPAVRRASPMALALLDSSEAGDLARVQASLAEGTSPDSQDSTGMTALMVAVVHDRGAVAELLLARGANVNAADDGGVTALMLAANNGRTALLQRLINRGATVNARSAAGWTALTYAAWNGHVPAARRLLEAGANPTLHDRIGWTALQYAEWRAADVSRTRLPDASDLLPPEEGGEVQVAPGRYREMVDLLSAPGRGR